MSNFDQTMIQYLQQLKRKRETQQSLIGIYYFAAGIAMGWAAFRDSPLWMDILLVVVMLLLQSMGRHGFGELYRLYQDFSEALRRSGS